MARLFQLVNGVDPAIPFINTSVTGIIAERGGFGTPNIPLGVDEIGQVVERWVFNIKASSHNDAATTIQALIKFARQAKEYRDSIWRTRPIVLEQQVTGESSQRYATIHEIRDLVVPDLFNVPFDPGSLVEGCEMTLVRDHPWVSSLPGTLASQVTLTKTDAPADDLLVHLANFQDTEDVDSIYVDDGGVFGSNFASTAAFELFPTIAVAGDALYIGSANPWKHIVFDLGTAGDFSATLVPEYWNGSAWVAASLGVTISVFGEGDPDLTVISDIFKVINQWIISIFPPTDWTTTLVNGQTKYWFRLRISSVTTWTILPANAVNQPYSQRKPYLEIPFSSIKGDSPPILHMRMFAPAIGGVTVGPFNLSRILIGAKSRNLANFVSHINASNNQMPSGWSTTFGTDTASAADRRSPSGVRADTTFATDSSLISRLVFTGTDRFADYIGEYFLMLRLQQIGGAAGDCKVKVRIKLGQGTNESGPHMDTPTLKTRGADKGFEVISFGLLQIPFSRVYGADDLTTQTITMDVYAQRLSGSATLRIYDLILFPVDEGIVGLDDPLTDPVNGSSALRGGTMLEIDAGQIADRTLKYSISSDTSRIPSEAWARMGSPLPLANIGNATRLYFLMLHYPAGGTWGGEPMVASVGNHLALQVRIRQAYTVLRGSD